MISRAEQASNERLNTEPFITHQESFLLESPKIQIYYETIIQAKSKQEIKTILHRQSGLISSGTFTAILGPSGSGKTTLLNFLSGRLTSDNLIVQGQLHFNSLPITSIEPYSNKIGYVMQDDALLATLTPRQCFIFSAKLRLDLAPVEIEKRVDRLIEQLGLSACMDTRVGNSYLKGISGGERKRTSIGVELITNPSIIFLDEPTTGLDSATALQTILLLKKLAQQGKTVISTIHQPSSELFCEFDRLMLLVEGRCIYLGSVEEARLHFQALGCKCPELMNASEFYLDMMSITTADDLEQGQSYDEIKTKHEDKIKDFETAYLKGPLHQLKQDDNLDPVEITKQRGISLFYELYLVAFRALICQVRNPMDVGFKLMQAVFTALIVLVVFGKIVDDPDNPQNVRGVIFFLVASNAFGGIQSTLSVFSTERPVFLRERYSRAYTTFSYFMARTGINLPFQLLYPSVGVTIVYWATGLGDGTILQWAYLLSMVNAVYFCSASYGLLYAAFIPKLETAMALVPVLIIPFMLLGGFFVDLDSVDDVRVIFYPIMYMSPFKYGFSAGMASLWKKQFSTPPELGSNIAILIGIGLILRIISILSMQKISNPKRPVLKAIID